MAKKNATVNLFVYGTLRREERQRITPDRFDIPAFRRNAFLETGKILDNAPFLGFATTSGKLFDVGRYPGMIEGEGQVYGEVYHCLLYTSPSPRDATLSRMPSSA